MEGAKQAFIKALKGDKSYAECRIKTSERKVLWVQDARPHFLPARRQGELCQRDALRHNQTEKHGGNLSGAVSLPGNLLNTILNPIFYNDTQGRTILQNFLFNSEKVPHRYSFFPNLGLISYQSVILSIE